MILRFSSVENFKDGDDIPFSLETRDGGTVQLIISAKWVQDVEPRGEALKHYVCEGELAEMNFS